MKSTKYRYNETADEFLEMTKADEGQGGNHVTISVEPHDNVLRYDISIDDYGHVVGAMNRLIQRINPSFIFPEKVANHGKVD